MKHIVRKYTLFAGFIVFAVSSAIRQLFPQAFDADMTHFAAGMGAGLMLLGVIFTIIFRNSDNDPEAIKRRAIEENDERNIRIKEKAGYASWHTTLILLVVMTLVFIFTDNPLAYWLSALAAVLHKLFLLGFTAMYNKKM
jgi:1,4-dihydroxy-2-naphthoate octaprenyltransferase